MRYTTIFFLAFISVSLVAQDKPFFTNMDVFQLEWVQDPQISPDGNKIVYIRRGMDIMKDRRRGNLWIFDRKTGDHTKLTSRDVNESSPRWSPDGSRIAFISSSEQGSELYIFWMNTGNTARLTQLERSPSGLSWSPDGKHLAFNMLVPEAPPSWVKGPKPPKGAHWAEKPRITLRVRYQADGRGYIEQGFRHIFVLPADGGTPRQVTSGNFQHNGTPEWTPDGEYILFSSNRNEDWEYQTRNSEIYKVSVSSGEISQLTTRNGPDYSPVVSPDGKTVAYLGFDDQVQAYQVSKMYFMNLDGSDSRVITADLDRAPGGLTWSADGKGVYFQYDDFGRTKIGFATSSGQVSELADNLGGVSVGRPYGGGSFSVSTRGVLAYTYTRPEHPADLAVVEKGEFKRLTELNSDLLNYRTLGRVSEVRYNSTVDNREIQGWVVTPPDYDPSRKYPLLVENHGGPISNYGERFSPEMQLYAAAGYVVFYPNPRGSTGYGEEFANLLYNNYPGDDYQDVMDGVDYLINDGQVDSDSLFVTGGSAGGIMTAWMVGKNNRFRSAAVVKPVMNWISKLLVADNYLYYAEYRYPGQVWENFENYWKFSPISLVGNVQTPTMVMVGLEDLRTPISEARQLYHALKLRKIETALVEIPGSYHFISNRPSHMITKVDHILAWFERYRKKND